MNLAATVIAVLIVIVGAIYSHQHLQPSTQKIEPVENQLKEPGISADQKESEEKPTPTQTPTPTPIQSPVPTPKQPALPNQTQIPSKLQYPNANKISTEANTSIYQSQDDPDTITDWYKEKIESLGMSAKSFVKTKTNDNVLNKLVGADGEYEIRVEITKSADSPTTEIKVTIQ
jgi:hypothetical protein